MTDNNATAGYAVLDGPPGKGWPLHMPYQPSGSTYVLDQEDLWTLDRAETFAAKVAASGWGSTTVVQVTPDGMGEVRTYEAAER